MTDEDMVLVQRIRFTGKRTGLESLPVKGFGRVSVGQIIEVTADEARRYTLDLPTRTGEASDFATVGGEYSIERSEVDNRRMVQRDKIQAKEAESLAEAEAEEVPVKDDAQALTDKHVAEVEPDAKKGRAKKE